MFGTRLDHNQHHTVTVTGNPWFALFQYLGPHPDLGCLAKRAGTLGGAQCATLTQLLAGVTDESVLPDFARMEIDSVQTGVVLMPPSARPVFVTILATARNQYWHSYSLLTIMATSSSSVRCALLLSLLIASAAVAGEILGCCVQGWYYGWFNHSDFIYRQRESLQNTLPH